MVLLDPLARPVIAHRGNRAHAPENTIAAFLRAVDAGADAIECDVRLTADGEVVVMHDPTVDRTTNGSGAVTALSLASIRELNAGARWSPHRDPEVANGGVHGGPAPFAADQLRVPLLAEALDALPDTPFMIECKTLDVAARTAEIVQKHGARDRVVIGSFVDAALDVARAAGLVTIASQRELRALIPALIFGRKQREARAFGAVAIPPTRYGIPLPIGGYARATSAPVHIWTVNDPTAAHGYWRRGARGIVTDDPATMVAARAPLHAE